MTFKWEYQEPISCKNKAPKGIEFWHYRSEDEYRVTIAHNYGEDGGYRVYAKEVGRFIVEVGSLHAAKVAGILLSR